MNHMPIPASITAWIRTARREDLETLAAAQLNTTAQMACAYDWDGAADWLETIATTSREANQRLLSPNGLPSPEATGDELTLAWRVWLGPTVETWQNDYDPTRPGEWDSIYSCNSSAPWTEELVRQMTGHLNEQQMAVFLSSMGRGSDDWHDASLTGDDIAEALHALDAALDDVTDAESVRVAQEDAVRANSERWSIQRTALAASSQAVRTICPEATEVCYQHAANTWTPVVITDANHEPLTGYHQPRHVALSMLPELPADLPLDDVTDFDHPEEPTHTRWLTIDRIIATATPPQH